MPSTSQISTNRSTSERTFTEYDSWRSTGGGWRQLSGNFHESGYSIEWHDFVAQADIDWSRSFHPEGLEICLNASGNGKVRAGRNELQLDGVTAGFYAQR